MDHHRQPLGRLLLARPLTFAERAEVEGLGDLWRVGDACASLVLVAPAAEADVVADLRRIVRRFCRPRDVGLRGAVVVETGDGLHVVTADGRRVRSRRLGPPGDAGPSGPGPDAGPATAQCRVIHLDQHRHRLRTALRDQHPDHPGLPGQGPEDGGWTS